MSRAQGRSNGVKKLLVIAVMMFAGFADTAHAADLTFTKFHSEIDIKNDASIQVTETMTADFFTSLHGIFRTIPYRFTTTDGKTSSIPINITSVTQDGKKAKYSLTTDSTNVTAKIGDPNKTIRGVHEYVIQYTALVATNFFDDHDELYWNVTGDQWDAPLSNISATVTIPEPPGIDDHPTPINQTACYTGSSGSTAQDCQQTHHDSTATFSSNDFLTIVVGWPKGFVTKPANFDQLRAHGTTQPLPNWLMGWRLLLNILLPIITIGVMMQRWWLTGRDPDGKKTIIAQYDPPDNLRPAELECLLNEHASPKAISATLVDLAVRGYIKIIESEKDRLIGKSKEYTLRSLKAPDDKLRDYEREVLKVIFKDHLSPASDNEVTLSEIKKRRYTTDPFRPVYAGILDSVVNGGYFPESPSKVRNRFYGLGILMVFLGVASFWVSLSLPGLFLAAVVVMIFAGAMPRRTDKGVEAVWVGRGFKLFLEKAEQYRIHWQERENIFETFLPYAMVFGIADKWSKALADVAKVQPEWYQGSNNAFTTVALWSSLNSLSTTTMHSFATTASSGGSGFSGGSSGGGGGGGGGGGW